jgi:hypothetical protein
MSNEPNSDDEEDRKVERAREALLKGPRSGLILKYYTWHLKQGFIRWVMKRPRRWIPMRIVIWAMCEARIVY